jgi:hypothetical protein
MNTYTAMVSAQVGNSSRLIKTQVRATSAGEAKWLLQAVYGFHALASFPTQEREVLTTEDSSHPATPEQQRLSKIERKQILQRYFFETEEYANTCADPLFAELF